MFFLPQWHFRENAFSDFPQCDVLLTSFSYIVGLSNKFLDGFSFLWSLFIKITQIASLPDYTTWLFQRRNQERENWGNCPWPTFAGGAPSAVFRKQISNPHLNSKTPMKNKSPTEILFTAEILVFYCRNTCLFFCKHTNSPQNKKHVNRTDFAGKSWEEKDVSHPRKASLPSLVGGWSQEQPWRRWARKELSGWRSSTRFFDAAWWWRLCPGTAPDSTRRSLRF